MGNLLPTSLILLAYCLLSIKTVEGAHGDISYNYTELVKEALQDAIDIYDGHKHGGHNYMSYVKLLTMFAPGNEITKHLEHYARISIQASKTLAQRLGTSFPNMRKDHLLLSAFKELDHFCPKEYIRCDPNSPYRTADGSCNNLQNPLWGKSFISEERFLDAQYDDGFNLPKVRAASGQPLPSARQISNDVFQNNNNPKLSPRNTVIVMGWGQFFDHDVTRTTISTDARGHELECCSFGACAIPDCFPIEIPSDDPHFNTTCMPFSRSSASASPDCVPGPREQVNEITSYIDASNVYGSTVEEQRSLRTFRKGLMKRKRRLLPKQNTGCIKDQSKLDYCFLAGDIRVNVAPHLAAIHNLFLREHNRIAWRLHRLNGHWSDERIFQEARKIVGALMQVITYGEYLPVMLGNDSMTEYGLHLSPGYNDIYDDSVNAGVRNAFAAAALRIGHTQVPEVQGLLSPDRTELTEIPLENTFERPHLVQTENGKNQPGMFRWLINKPAAKTDGEVVKPIRDLLFVDEFRKSFDLIALNIQRGRDHGLPRYNDWREWCDLPRVTHFGTSAGGLVNHSSDVAQRLEKAYDHVDDIELYPGGVSETHVQGGNMGPTFACIMGRQFNIWKTGDRFWHELSDPVTIFSEDQLREIKKMTLAKIICRLMGIDEIQPNVFRKVGDGPSNDLVKCRSLPDMFLRYWEESEPYH